MEMYLENNTSDKLFTDTRTAFASILACFQLLSGQGDALNIDLKEFCDCLYTQLLRLSVLPAFIHSSFFTGESKTALDLAIQSIELIFLKRKEVSVERVCAFTKRLLSISLSLPAESCLKILNLVCGLMSKYPRLGNLLDIDECVGTGVYKPEVNDPDQCGAFRSCFWELLPLMRHYDAKVAELAVSISKGNFKQVKG